MTKKQENKREADGIADAIAATAIITIAVLAMYLWLSGLPS